MDLITLRTTLVISLSVLVLLMAWRLFKRRVMARDLPVVSHAELLALEVAYHPARLRVRISMPGKEEIRSALFDAHHLPVRTWPPEERGVGKHVFERDLPDLPDGLYHFELSTATQRTVRQFRLQQA